FRLREMAAAKAALRKALPLLEGLATESPAALRPRLDLAECQGLLGHVLETSGDGAGAEREFRRALDLLRRLEKDFPEEKRVRWRLLEQLNEFTRFLTGPSASGDWATVESVAPEAIALGQKWIDAGSEPALQVELARAHRQWGDYLGTVVGNQAGSKAAYQEAVRLLSKLVAQFPRSLR